jgi:hypothetical protein
VKQPNPVQPARGGQARWVASFGRIFGVSFTLQYAYTVSVCFLESTPKPAQLRNIGLQMIQSTASITACAALQRMPVLPECQIKINSGRLAFKFNNQQMLAFRYICYMLSFVI